VGAQGGPYAGVQTVGDAVVVAGLPESIGEEWIDRVRQAGREVVFDSVVEAADEPSDEVSDDREWSGDVGGGGELVGGKVVAAAGRPR
jgi:hypothetical protein